MFFSVAVVCLGNNFVKLSVSRMYALQTTVGDIWTCLSNASHIVSHFPKQSSAYSR